VPLRQQVFNEVCVDCEQFSSTVCIRCPGPLCGEHAGLMPASRKGLCRSCWNTWLKRRPGEEREFRVGCVGLLVCVLIVLLGGLVFLSNEVAILTAVARLPPWVYWLFVTPAIATIGWAGSKSWRYERGRRAFLAEKVPKRQTIAPKQSAE